MRILLTNDDGIHAPGLQALERIARTLGIAESLASDILKDERNTVRLSVGPSFHFGQ